MSKRVRCSDCDCCRVPKVFGICLSCQMQFPSCEWDNCPDLAAVG